MKQRRWTRHLHVIGSLSLYIHGCCYRSPKHLWDLLLPQTEITLNFLRQATLEPSRYTWSYFHGPFNYDATPIRPLVCYIIAHIKTGKRHYWDFRGAASWNVGVAPQHYRCHTIVEKALTQWSSEIITLPSPPSQPRTALSMAWTHSHAPYPKILTLHATIKFLR